MAEPKKLCLFNLKNHKMSLEILNNPFVGNFSNEILGGDSQNTTAFKPSDLKTPTELKQKTVKQIANTYYNGKPVAESNGFQIYSDEPIFGGTIEEVIIYRNRFTKAIGGIEVVIFASKNGAFLLQRYMEALPQSNELILFLEINDEFNYNTVLRSVAGTNLTNKKDIPFADILTFARKHEVTITPDKFKELIQDGIYRNKVSLISWFLGLKDAAVGRIFNFFTQKIFQEAENFFTGIADGIAGLKVSENGWNPNPKEGEYSPTFIPEALYNELKKFYEHEASKNPYENLKGQKQVISKIIKVLFEKINNVKSYFKNLLGAAAPLFPDYIYKRVNQALDLLFKQIDSIEGYLADPLTGIQHIVYKSFQMANAFLCGIYNSIIDIIAGIFSLIGFIFKAVYEMKNISDNKVEYGEMFLELIEDLIEGIVNFNYKDFLYLSITFQLKTIVRLVKWIENTASGFTLEKASYYYGYIIGIIIDVVVETLLTGGTAALAKLAKSIESFMLKPLEKITQGIEKTVNFTKDLITRVLEFIQMLLREFKKGAKELFTKISKLIDEVFGLGEDVANTPKARAEERWNKKQEKIKKKLDRRRNKDVAKSGGYYTERVTIKHISDDLAHVEIKNFEKIYSQDKIEHGKLFDDEGNNLSHLIIGDEKSIRVKLLDITQARKKLRELEKNIGELIFTHNHPPPGSSLSYEDILLAIRYNIKEFRAINPDGSVFQLVRKEPFGINEQTIFTFQSEVNKILTNNFKNLKKGSIEYQLKQADVAIELLGKKVKYTHYKP